MPVEMVLTAVARDRPGIIEALSDAVVSHGGNWVDSSMAVLAGEFAGVVRVSIPDAAATDFRAELAKLAAEGIDVSVRRDALPESLVGMRAGLEMTGVDHPGIIHKLSSTLADQNVSIDELDTRVFPASMSGEPMFVARATVVLPPGLTLHALQDALEDIAQDLVVDIEVRGDEIAETSG